VVTYLAVGLVVVAVVISEATGHEHMMITRTTVMFPREHMLPVII
jgi:hypothetical protein